MPIFHRRFHTAAPISDFVSPRFPPLHHSRHDDTLLLSSCASLRRRRPLQPGFLNRYHLRQPPSKMKDLRAVASPDPLTAHMLATLEEGGGGLQLSARLRVQVKSGRRQTDASALTLAVNQLCVLVGAEARLAQKSACRCLLALRLWQLIANRLCLVSTDTCGGC